MSIRRMLYFVILLVAVPTILVVASVVVWAVNVSITEERQPEAFIAYLDDYTDLKMTDTNESEWLRLGDESCNWLADQPYPWFSRADRFQHSGLSAKFWRENPPPAAWKALNHSENPRNSIVPAAWSTLCADTWELHEPHNPFNRERSD